MKLNNIIKSISFIIIIFSISILTNCNDVPSNIFNETSSTVENKDSLEERATNWLKTLYPDIKFRKHIQLAYQNGNLINNDYKNNAYLYAVEYGENYEGDYTGDYYTYIAVELFGKVEFRFMCECFWVKDGHYIILNDIDGDGIDEIIVQQNIDNVGGAGQYLTSVFKISENNIVNIFQSPDLSKEMINYVYQLFNTGYSIELIDGFKGEMKNDFTNYKKIIDLSGNEFTDIFYNQAGEIIDNENIELFLDSFYKLDIVDYDNDGIYELKCTQYAYLDVHTNYIGDVVSILKFNNEKESFDVIAAEFIDKLKE